MLKLIIISIAIGLTAGYEEFADGYRTNFERIIRPATLYTNEKEQTARKFIESYNSPNPVVLLIDNAETNHDDAANFVDSLPKLDADASEINLMLMKFNTSGVSSVLETSKNNRKRLDKLLRQPVVDPSSFLGVKQTNKSAAFFATLNAAHILPSDSGIVLFIRRGANDEVLAQYALKEVKKKRIRVYVVWGREHPSSDHEETILEDLATRSGGAFLINSYRNLSDQHYEQFLNNKGLYTNVAMILSRKNVRGEYNLHFPVDSDVTGVHISMTEITSGILTTPKGSKIDVLDGEEVAGYTSGSFARRDPVSGVHEVHLNTTTATTQDVGVWRLRVRNTRASYNVTIFAHTKLTANAAIAAKNLTDDVEKTGSRKRVMKLGVTGDISLISNISFVNEDGQEISDNVKFNVDKNWENYLAENVDNIETNHNKELDIDVKDVPKGPFYVVINGKNSRGHDFRRLSYVTDGTQFTVPPLTIDVGFGSQLIVQANTQPEIIFEVTNNGNKAVLVQFTCKDTEAILLAMTPWFKWISPQETATVRVTLTTRPGSYKDRVTFTAKGSVNVEKEVYVDVGSAQSIDSRNPEIDYQYTSDCTSVVFADCMDGTWTIEVKAKDTGSGLLQLTSNPKGLNFPNGFITGTTETVTAYYTGSCCRPDLELIAVDRQHNRKTRQVNAYRAGLGPAAIAAIVLGILLIILIIVAVVFAVRKCCAQKKESYDLPTYRAPTGSRRL